MIRLVQALVLLTASLAFGNGRALEPLREKAQAVQAQVEAIRAEQNAQRLSLSAVGSRIEALKSAPKKNARSAELDQALKRSQELSEVLTGLAQSLKLKSTALDDARAALVDALGAELKALRTAFDASTRREERALLLTQMKAVRTERDALGQALPASRLPSAQAFRPSEDPEELLQQADVARDAEDRVRKDLAALEQRIAEAKEEQALDARLRQFAGEESLFDDSDRRFRLARPSSVGSAAARAQADGPGLGAAASKTAGAAEANTAATATAAPPPDQGTARADSTNPGDTAFTQSAAAPASSNIPTGGTAREIGSPTPPSSSNAASGDSAARVPTNADNRPSIGAARSTGLDRDDLSSLLKQKQRLQGLAGELRDRATALEQKAHALDSPR